MLPLLTLDYRLDPTVAEKAKEIDMASADAVSLRYRLFPGDVFFRGESVDGVEVDFSTHWGWVQILDLALSLVAIGATLERDGEARFEFTESNAALSFRLEGETVCVSSSYAHGLMRVPFPDFRERVKGFAHRVSRELCKKYPRLELNPEMNGLTSS